MASFEQEIAELTANMVELKENSRSLEALDKLSEAQERNLKEWRKQFKEYETKLEAKREQGNCFKWLLQSCWFECLCALHCLIRKPASLGRSRSCRGKNHHQSRRKPWSTGVGSSKRLSECIVGLALFAGLFCLQFRFVVV